MAAATETTATAAPEGGASCTPTDTTAAALEWSSLAPLKRPERGVDQYMWDLAVAPAVTVLGCIVVPYIDVAAIHIPPDHDAIVSKLRDNGRGDAVVASFQSEWEALDSTLEGRAVIAVCRAAAEGGALLGRVYYTRTAEEWALEPRLEAHFKGSEWLPVLLAAVSYYRQVTAMLIAPTKREWPADELESLWPTGPHGSMPEEWCMAVAPAVTAASRIVAHFIPNLAKHSISPYASAVVGKMQSLGLDEKVPVFLAAWEELGSTRDGRAVIALCRAAVSYAALGAAKLAKLADDRRLDRELVEWYGDKECLPVLQAAVRYYRAQEAPAAGGAGGGGAAVGCGAAAAAGSGAAAVCGYESLRRCMGLAPLPVTSFVASSGETVHISAAVYELRRMIGSY